MLFAVSEPININRTEWGITYKSTKFIDGLKDNFINDNMEIQVIAVFDLVED